MHLVAFMSSPLKVSKLRAGMVSAVKLLVPIIPLNAQEMWTGHLLVTPLLAGEGPLASADEWQS